MSIGTYVGAYANAYAAMSTFIRCSWKESPTGTPHEKTERFEEEIQLSDEHRTRLMRELTKRSREGEDASAKVTSSVSTKVSDAVYWGKGQWDKIPYSVEIFSSVSLECDQNAEAVQTAQEVAYDLAWEHARAMIGRTVVGHATNIQKNLYPELFNEDSE